MRSRSLLCWIDLETTGLVPEQHLILEAAVVVTNTELEPMWDPLTVCISRDNKDLATMNEYVRKMHQQTGLLDRVARSALPSYAAFGTMLSYVRDHTRDAKQVILAGNSVHFDRKFLAYYVPQLESMFYHRHVDVSTLKQLASWWGYPEYDKKGTEHMALDDIKNSIAELRHYRETMLAHA